MPRPLVRARPAARLEPATCPYCRDAIPSGAFAEACERVGCGARYHAECWSECRARYGGCAVYGCGSIFASPFGRAPASPPPEPALVRAALDAATTLTLDEDDSAALFALTHPGLSWGSLLAQLPLQLAVVAAALALLAARPFACTEVVLAAAAVVGVAGYLIPFAATFTLAAGIQALGRLGVART